jgi:pyruvate/2-oxoglutarate dehydrogenase complex dihydrolipoamide dehydrogenase (E3) component
MRAFQERIKSAKKIAVIGGGAVGIEMASDIKSFYPEKDITLVHSRDQLLLHFGPRLHEHVVEAFNKLGIEIIFQERPETLPGIDRTSRSLLFSDGRTEEFDLIVGDNSFRLACFIYINILLGFHAPVSNPIRR